MTLAKTSLHGILKLLFATHSASDIQRALEKIKMVEVRNAECGMHLR